MKKLITLLMLVTIGLASCTKEEIEPIDTRQKYYFKLFREYATIEYVFMINGEKIEPVNNQFIAHSGDNVMIIRSNSGWWMLYIHTSDWDENEFPWPDNIRTLTSGMHNSSFPIIFDEILE